MRPVDVANMALGFLNLDEIATIEDGNVRAVTVRLVWEVCRKAFLQEFDWSFAKRGALLTPMTEQTPPYIYAYLCPPDMLKAIQVVRSNEYHKGALPFEVRLASDGKNRIVGCDFGNVMLEYVSSIPALDVFSPLAVEALACRLAFHLCQSLKHDSSEMQTLWQTYQMSLAAAITKDAENRTYPPFTATSLNRSRQIGLCASRDHSIQVNIR